MKVTLSKPIQAHGAEVSALELREPTGADIRASGLPYKIEFTGQATQIMITDAEAVARLIARCAGIPPSSVDLLSAPDFNALQAVVMGFFGDAIPATGSTAPTS